MAINLVPNPNTSAPVLDGDWTLLYNQAIAGAVPQASILTDWESTTAAPALKQGAFIRYEGNYYQVQTSNETISGTVSNGVNYIALTLSGTVLTAAWVTSLTGYTFDGAYGGLYNTDSVRKLIIPDLCYLDGTDYIRGIGYGEGFEVYRLSDGRIAISSVLEDLTVEKDLTVTEDVLIGGHCLPDGIDFSGSSVFSDIGDSELFPKGFLRAEVVANAASAESITVSIQRKSSYGTDNWIEVESYILNDSGGVSETVGFLDVFSNGSNIRFVLDASTDEVDNYCFVSYIYY